MMIKQNGFFFTTQTNNDGFWNGEKKLSSIHIESYDLSHIDAWKMPMLQCKDKRQSNNYALLIHNVDMLLDRIL